MCDSLSDWPQRHNCVGSQEEKFVEPKVLLRTLPIITVKTCFCVCMYICVGAVRPTNRNEISVGGPIYHYSKNVFIYPSLHPCGEGKGQLMESIFLLAACLSF